MGRLRAGLLTALAIVTGCGLGSGGQPSSAPSSATEPSKPAPDGLGSADAAADLSDFSCAPGDDGRWKASGFLTNPRERTASYAVTVVVAGADVRDAEGKRRTLPALPGDPTPFTIAKVPVAAGVNPTCSVRVVRLR